MCDSVSIVFLIREMPLEERERLNFPYKTLIPLDNNGELGTPFGRWETGRSPLTSEGYRVRAVFRWGGGQHPVLVGYEMELNPPACIIGNNLLLKNGVFRGGWAALYLLQYWLAEQGCSKEVVNSFSTTTAVIRSVTLTYLANCSNKTGAHTARRGMYSQGAALHNKKTRKKRLRKDKVYEVGTKERATVYMKHHDYQVSCYVKDGVVGGASSRFASPEVEAALRAEAGKYLRVEITLNHSWLEDKHRQSIQSWKYVKGDSPYDIGIETIRSYLRLDENLRTRMPKLEHLDKLSAEEKQILVWHLEGRNVRKHISLRGSNSRRFYPIRQRLLRKVRVDLSIPWEVQRNELHPKLGDLLAINGQYKPPKELADHVYCRRSIDAALDKLKTLIKKRLEASGRGN
ncbi:MAG: hypothetical protein PHP57_13745 [Sideroxydans sp.]|nr:hypothetical protein [Sideroxydans sp.]